MIRTIVRDQKFRAGLLLRSSGATTSCYHPYCNRTLSRPHTTVLPISRVAYQEDERQQRYRWFSTSRPLYSELDKAAATTTSLAVDENDHDAGKESGGDMDRKPLFRQSPLWELNDYYFRTHGTAVTRLVKSYMNTDSSDSLWTSEFTCPQTDRVYRSGIFFPESIGEAVTGSDRAFEKVWRGKKTVFYQKKSTAVNAAAARVLDSIRFEKDGSLDPRLCVEHPAGTIEDVEITEEENSEESPEGSSLSTKKSPNSNVVVSSENPLQDLAAFYKANLGYDGNVSDLVESEMEIISKLGNAWTAQFVCPVSHRVFRSATFRTVDKPGGSVIHVDDKKRVFYRKKGTAIQAAASRALDVFCFEKDGVLEPRLCKEDPLDDAVSSDEEDEADEEKVEEENSIDKNELALDSSDDEEEEKEKEKKVDVSLVLDVDQLAQADTGSNRISPTHTVLKEDDDELVAYQPPALDNGECPATRLLKSLSGSTISSANGLATPRDLFAGSKLVESENERVRHVVAEVNTWLESVSDCSPRSVDLHGVRMPRHSSTTDLVIAKALLYSLAEANLACLSPRSTQAEATNILNFLWATKNSRPDADVYNYYLKCLEGSDPVTRAIKAESIVERMKHRDSLQGNIPPMPNKGTFNALLSIWAQVGGVNGRYTKLSESFEPNRESFLAILSSSSYMGTSNRPDSIFDTEFANLCIERMQELYSETGDESLKIDTQVLNAPLRWSGGLLWKRTRPNTRRVDWDDHQVLYEGGFAKYRDTDPLVLNAQRVEEWVYGMNKFGVSPDIESYEAAVQAWVRTGTREGLEKAEAVIEGIPSHIRIRAQTLHPIFAAWLHVKHADSPSKILKWIEILRSADEAARAALNLDLRFQCLEIAAHILRQDLMNVASPSDTPEPEMTVPSTDEVEMWELPRRCSVLFDNLTRQIKDAPVAQHSILLPLLVDPAMLTITAWGRIATRPGTDKDACHIAVKAMFHVADLYENVLQDVAKKEAESKKTELCAAVLSEQTKNLVAASHQILYSLVTQIHIIFKSQLGMESKTDRATKESTENPRKHSDLLVPYIHQLERITRRLAEFKEVGSFSSPKNSLSPLVFADQYDYQFSALTSTSSSVDASAFGWKMLNMLRDTSFPEYNRSDVARLCNLLKNLRVTGTEEDSSKKTKFGESVDSLIHFAQYGMESTDLPQAERKRGHKGHYHATHPMGAIKRVQRSSSWSPTSSHRQHKSPERLVKRSV